MAVKARRLITQLLQRHKARYLATHKQTDLTCLKLSFRPDVSQKPKIRVKEGGLWISGQHRVQITILDYFNNSWLYCINITHFGS